MNNMNFTVVGIDSRDNSRVVMCLPAVDPEEAEKLACWYHPSINIGGIFAGEVERVDTRFSAKPLTY